jgi:hypothetical protein
MRYVLDLLSAGHLTGDARYGDRALELLRDWVVDNPRTGAPSPWAWNDHSTALRAVVLACVGDELPIEAWLRDALITHGVTLADPTFYRKEGNHALNQAIGLLEVGRVLDRRAWVDLAAVRIHTLVVRSIDPEGVTNEQSVGYQLYNFRRYRHAEARLLATGGTVSSGFGRVDRMPSFLAHATLPNGTYEMIGDTAGGAATPIAGTPAEYAATAGASGPKPDRTVARFMSGYLFVRSGWGEVRDPRLETFLSTRWGRGPAFHGHADGLQLTLAAYGSRLLLDSGMYSYTPSSYRTYFKRREAHNVVTVDGLQWRSSTPTRLLGSRVSSSSVDIRLSSAGYPGVAQTRRITYVRGLDVVIVQDHLSSATPRVFRQLWHLPEDARPSVGATSVTSRRVTANIQIRQLLSPTTLKVVTGRSDPVQGWVSYRYGQRVAAPVVEAIKRGTNVRYLTLIVPAAGAPLAAVRDVSVTPTGYRLTVTVGRRTERIVAAGSSLVVTRLT